MDWNNLSDINDWGDLSKMMEAGAEKPAEPVEKSKPDHHKEDADIKPNVENKNTSSDPPAVADLDVGGWTDMKQFDDDHDPDWFEEEENRLAKIYGGHFIKVKYTEQGRPGYFCDLCMAEMNAKPSLESHCEGMKHLKKKAIWEKNNGGASRDHEDNRGGWNESSANSRNRDRDRSPLRDYGARTPPRSRESRFDPTSGSRRDNFDRGNRNGSFRGREFARSRRDDDDERRPSNRNRLESRLGGRQSDDRYKRSNDRSRGPSNDMFGGSSNDRSGGPPNDRFGGAPNDRFGGPSNDRSGGPPNDRFGGAPNDRFGGPSNDRSGGPPNDRFGGPPNDRFGGPSNDRSGGPPNDRFGGPPNDRFGGQGNNGSQFDRKPATPGPAAPVACVPKEKLTGGTTGLLLTKLASCYMKDEEDADLALNVVSSLASSLREYYTKKKEKKIAELLMEAELKLNTLKALKVGLKLLVNKQEAAAAAPAYPAGPPSYPQYAPNPYAPNAAYQQQQQQQYHGAYGAHHHQQQQQQQQQPQPSTYASQPQMY